MKDHKNDLVAAISKSVRLAVILVVILAVAALAVGFYLVSVVYVKKLPVIIGGILVGCCFGGPALVELMKKHKKAQVAVLLVVALVLGFGGGYMTASNYYRNEINTLFHMGREKVTGTTPGGFTLEIEE